MLFKAIEYKVEFAKYKRNIYIYYLTIFLIITNIACLNYFHAYNLLTEEIILISDVGIIIMNPDTKSEEKRISIEDNIISDKNEIEFISFNQIINEDIIYLFCRIKQYIYIVNYNSTEINKVITEEDMAQSSVSLIPYKDKDQNNYLIYSYINEQNLTIIKMYNYINNSFKKNITTLIENESGINSKSLFYAISCQLMNSSKYNNYLLVCFIENELYLLTGLVFNPEDNLNYLYLIKYNENKGSIKYMKTALSKDKKNCFICYDIETFNNNYECIIFNLENKIWAEPFLFIEDASGNWNFDVYYSDDVNGYFLFFPQSLFVYAFINLDENFRIKSLNNSQNCFTKYEINECSEIYSSSIIYNQNINKGIVNCQETSDLSSLIISEIEYNCYYSTIFTEFDIIEKLKSLPTYIIELESSNAFFSSISSSNEEGSNFINIFFIKEGDIFKGEIKEKKEDLEHKLDEIMNIIEIGKKYIIFGEDYNITINKNNNNDEFLKNVNVDLKECEEILRNEYKMSPKETLTLFQIEIDKMNNYSLTRKVEYALFNEKKIRLDLSYCENIDIKISYNIINDLPINKSMISYYSNMGIDVFNIKDPFFNDICYSFSNSESDIILKDRVEDIYQNYSLCENNCEYEKFDIESMSVKCNCKLKKEINVTNETPNFGKIIKDIFKDSSFGVIKCFNKVFSFNNKINNIGFWIFLINTCLLISLYIFYICKGIKTISDFVSKEMIKYDYMFNIINPLKINKNKNKNNINKNENSLSNNENNIFVVIIRYYFYQGLLLKIN